MIIELTVTPAQLREMLQYSEDCYDVHVRVNTDTNNVSWTRDMPKVPDMRPPKE